MLQQNINNPENLDDQQPRIIVNRDSYKVFDIYGASKTQGANLIQYTPNLLLHQQFIFETIQNNIYKIVCNHSGFVLSVKDSKMDDSTQIIQQLYNGGSNQHWRLEPSSQGYYHIYSVLSNKVLEVQRSSKENEAKIIQLSLFGSNYQNWKILSLCNIENNSQNIHKMMEISFLDQSTECQLCYNRIKYENLDSHSQTCEARLDICQYCYDQYPIAIMQEHQEICPSIQIKPLKIKICLKPNPSSLNQQVQQIKQENAKIKQQVQQTKQEIAIKKQSIQLIQQIRQEIANQQIKNPVQPIQPQPPQPLQKVSKQPQPQKQPQQPNQIEYILNEQNADKLNEELNKILDQGGQVPNLPQHDQSDVGGLNKQQIDQFYIIQYKKNEKLVQEYTFCLICQEQFEQDSQLRLLTCTHRFHINCIDQWIKKNPTCPICKFNLKKQFEIK